MNFLQKYEIEKRLFRPLARISLQAMIFAFVWCTLDYLSRGARPGDAYMSCFALSMAVAVMINATIEATRKYTTSKENWLENWAEHSGYQTQGKLNGKRDDPS
jgi:hypothetical protein